eukprot:NODE_118_length_18907_cov_0.436251.p1 type:complete len:523 gc:universal NODE_118_length_18907_cov_0.436251:11621-13189(+)
MKWLLTLNSTCSNNILDEVTNLLSFKPFLHLYQNFPVAEVDLSDQHMDLVKHIPCVIHFEKQIKFRAYEMESPSSWVLDALDGTDLDDSYSFNRTGQGVTVYVIDSGIDARHREFDNRANMTKVVFEDVPDCTGHGTHVAGLIGGRNVGVAKQVNIQSIKVITCNEDSDYFIIVRAYDAIITNFKQNGLKSALVNLSLGPHAVNGTFPVSHGLEQAITSAFNLNILTVAASGNDNLNACSGTPSRLDSVVTVGAVDANFQKAEFSNFGPCVKVFSPGTNSVSAQVNTTDKYLVKQGTSQAAPLVTGVLALIMQDNPNALIQEVYQILREQSIQFSGNEGSVLVQSYIPNDDKSNNIQFDSIDYHSLEDPFVFPTWAIILMALAFAVIVILIAFKLTKHPPHISAKSPKTAKSMKAFMRLFRRHPELVNNVSIPTIDKIGKRGMISSDLITDEKNNAKYVFLEDSKLQLDAGLTQQVTFQSGQFVDVKPRSASVALDSKPNFEVQNRPYSEFTAKTPFEYMNQ